LYKVGYNLDMLSDTASYTDLRGKVGLINMLVLSPCDAAVVPAYALATVNVLVDEVLAAVTKH
jgi:hypothetical protein